VDDYLVLRFVGLFLNDYLRAAFITVVMFLDKVVSCAITGTATTPIAEVVVISFVFGA
jgi:hypothetical protein